MNANQTTKPNAEIESREVKIAFSSKHMTLTKTQIDTAAKGIKAISALLPKGITPATLNPYRANAGRLLAVQLAKGATPDMATLHACASQCMKNATPGPMAAAAVLIAAAASLKSGEEYIATVKHREHDADLVQTLPVAMGPKAKAAKKAKK